MLSVSEAIGRFHPVLVHLPIGILVAAVALHWLSGKPQLAISQQVVKLLYGAGIAGALLASITGFLLSNSGDYEGGTVALHMWLAIGTTTLALLLFARLAQHKRDARWLSLGVLALITLTGHFGGSLTHGDDYLTAAWQDEGLQPETPVKPIANIQEAAVYADVVQPLLQSRCVACHGPNKQKGGLRMDSPEYLMKGGKNGAIIETGAAAQSELIKRLLLPREDEHHMPPKQKPQLTEAQVDLLHWWIGQGAPFDKKIAALQQPEKIKPMLASLQQGGAREKAASLAPDMAVPPADGRAVAALRKKGVVVLPVDAGSNWLAANFVTARFTDADAALLEPLKAQLLLVKMNGTQVGDATLKALAACTHLAVLHLNNTKATDAGLSYLQPLANLRSLSLVGTSVTVKGVLALRGLPQLQQLYLYASPAVQGWPQLRAAFPKALIDTGGYRLPLLPGDTSEVQPPKRP